MLNLSKNWMYTNWIHIWIQFTFFQWKFCSCRKRPAYMVDKLIICNSIILPSKICAYRVLLIKVIITEVRTPLCMCILFRHIAKDIARNISDYSLEFTYIRSIYTHLLWVRGIRYKTIKMWCSWLNGRKQNRRVVAIYAKWSKRSILSFVRAYMQSFRSYANFSSMRIFASLSLLSSRIFSNVISVLTFFGTFHSH